MTDAELWAKHRAGCESAFADVVRRHLPWVYGLARRRLKDAHQAEDVAQAVFVLLHTKSPRFSCDSAMIGWMHKAAWYATQVAIRNDRRRQRRETEAAMLQPRSTDSSSELQSEYQQLAPLLDELIGRLNRSDREAILLRYYREMSFAEVGAEAGTTAEAARKRVDRAVEKLRLLASDKGISISSIALAGSLAGNLNISPPAGLLATATTAATAQAGSALAASSAPIVKGASFMLSSAKFILISFATFLAILAMIWLSVASKQHSDFAKAVAEKPKANAPATAPDRGSRGPFPGLSPFSATRWHGAAYEVQVNQKWYELLAIEDQPAAQVMDFAQKTYGNRWQKRVDEDLVELLSTMGHQPKLTDAGDDGDGARRVGTTKLQLRELDTGKVVTMEDAAMTRANRQAVWSLRNPSIEVSSQAPLAAIRWTNDKLQMQVKEVWYDVFIVNNSLIDKIVQFAKSKYGDDWKKKIETSLPDVLAGMGQAPGDTMTLQLFAQDAPSAYPSKPGGRFEKLAPFTGVRWRDPVYQVEVNGTWYEFVGLNDLTADSIFDFAKKNYRGEEWHKRFEEDLVEVLAGMGHLPGDTVTLKLRPVGGGDVVTMEHVAMTNENRQAIMAQKEKDQAP